MADSTSISVEMTDQRGNKLTRSITNVSPSATNADMYNFTIGLLSLTTNTFNNAYRVDKTWLTDNGGDNNNG